MAAQHSKQSFSLIWPAYRPFLKYVKPDLRYIGMDYFTILVAVITNTAMIWLIGSPFNLLQNGQFNEIPRALLLFGTIIIVNQIMQVIGGLITQWVGFRSIGRMRNAVVSKLVFLSFPVLNHMSKGDLLARVSNDVDRVKLCVVDALLFLPSHFLTVSFYVFMLFWIDVELAFVALAVTPIYIVHQRFFAPRKKRNAERFLHANGKLLSIEEQILNQLQSVSLFAAENRVSNLHKNGFARAAKWAYKERALDVWFSVSFTLLIYLTGLLIVLFGVYGIQQGRFGIGHLVSFLLYLGYLTVPVRGFAEIIFQFLGSLGAAHRVQNVLNMENTVYEVENPKKLTITQGQITCNNVSFAHFGRDNLYKNLNFSLKGGSKVAIVGPSGVGKSSFSLLLTRFFDPQKGNITIDGIDIREVRLQDLRSQITLVSQNPFLFDDTIRQNLLLACPDADELAIVSACKSSHAWEFIQQMEKGLDTPIGANGLSLSTGQKQRLALTQAFLRRSPILILDEATSALDSHSEQVVISSIHNLKMTCTVLIISHRYSTIKSADSVIYFNAYGEVSVGKHAELMSNHDDYRNAVHWQTSLEEGKAS